MENYNVIVSKATGKFVPFIDVNKKAWVFIGMDFVNDFLNEFSSYDLSYIQVSKNDFERMVAGWLRFGVKSFNCVERDRQYECTIASVLNGTIDTNTYYSGTQYNEAYISAKQFKKNAQSMDALKKELLFVPIDDMGSNMNPNIYWGTSSAMKMYQKLKVEKGRYSIYGAGSEGLVLLQNIIPHPITTNYSSGNYVPAFTDIELLKRSYNRCCICAMTLEEIGNYLGNTNGVVVNPNAGDRLIDANYLRSIMNPINSGQRPVGGGAGGMNVPPVGLREIPPTGYKELPQNNAVPSGAGNGSRTLNKICGGLGLAMVVVAILAVVLSMIAINNQNLGLLSASGILIMIAGFLGLAGTILVVVALIVSIVFVVKYPNIANKAPMIVLIVTVVTRLITTILSVNMISKLTSIEYLMSSYSSSGGLGIVQESATTGIIMMILSLITLITQISLLFIKTHKNS